MLLTDWSVYMLLTDWSVCILNGVCLCYGLKCRYVFD